MCALTKRKSDFNSAVLINNIYRWLNNTLKEISEKTNILTFKFSWARNWRMHGIYGYMRLEAEHYVDINYKDMEVWENEESTAPKTFIYEIYLPYSLVYGVNIDEDNIKITSLDDILNFSYIGEDIDPNFILPNSKEGVFCFCESFQKQFNQHPVIGKYINGNYCIKYDINGIPLKKFKQIAEWNRCVYLYHIYQELNKIKGIHIRYCVRDTYICVSHDFNETDIPLIKQLVSRLLPYELKQKIRFSDEGGIHVIGVYAEHIKNQDQIENVFKAVMGYYNPTTYIINGRYHTQELTENNGRNYHDAIAVFK